MALAFKCGWHLSLCLWISLGKEKIQSLYLFLEAKFTAYESEKIVASGFIFLVEVNQLNFFSYFEALVSQIWVKGKSSTPRPLLLSASIS